MNSAIGIVLLFYLIFDWVLVMVTGESNYSHALDIISYPFVVLLWMLCISRSEKLTKFVIWINIVTFFALLIFAVVFFRTLGDVDYILYDNKEISKVSEVDDKYIIQMSDKTTYYANTNSSISYNIDNWKIYQYVREDMFNDTLFGALYFGNGEDFLQINYMK